MRRAFLLAALAAPLALLPATSQASLLARVSNSRQQMQVFVDNRLAYVWPVSTARAGFVTPPGSYAVQRMHPMWRSRKYNGAPMPYAMFFYGGYAIHGTYSVAQLGRPASHGCVRLAPGNARTLFGLAQRNGGAQVQVTY